MGYCRAGLEVYGIDNKPQPHYPFPFLQMDAMEAMDRLLRGEGLTFSNGETLYLSDFAAYHASPPCQGYSNLKAMHPEGEWVLMIEPVRGILQKTGKHFVIENVEEAPLHKRPDLFGNKGVMLCGSMFGLGIERGYLRRHRIFEASFSIPQLPCRHKGVAVGVYGHGGHSGKHRMLYRKEAAEAMRIDWMGRDEMCQAIPPAYTEYIGSHLMKQLRN